MQLNDLIVTALVTFLLAIFVTVTAILWTGKPMLLKILRWSGGACVDLALYFDDWANSIDPAFHDTLRAALNEPASRVLERDSDPLRVADRGASDYEVHQKQRNRRNKARP